MITLLVWVIAHEADGACSWDVYLTDSNVNVYDEENLELLTRFLIPTPLTPSKTRGNFSSCPLCPPL